MIIVLAAIQKCHAEVTCSTRLIVHHVVENCNLWLQEELEIEGQQLEDLELVKKN